MSAERLHVDRTRCDGRGLCTELLPELLDRDGWGYPIVRDPQVPRALRRDARDAVRACPVRALRLLEASDPSQRVRVAPHSPAGPRAAH